MARPIPVLPLVASITVCPGLSVPLRSAASITPSASRSLTEPSGLKASSFTKTSTPGGGNFATLTTGVRPTVSRILSNRGMVSPPIDLRCCESGECRQGLLDHPIGSGEADAQIPRRGHDRARHDENLAICKRIPMPVGIALRPFAPQIERALRPQHLEARARQRPDEVVTTARERGPVDRQFFKIAHRVLHHRIGKTPAERHLR